MSIKLISTKKGNQNNSDALNKSLDDIQSEDCGLLPEDCYLEFLDALFQIRIEKETQDDCDSQVNKTTNNKAINKI
ncbi:MAG: hypothetical protein M1480_05625 [Bacteroidetes bacterium]|nr:hypothetical protein [Bacteroidota bacterium]